MHQRIAACNRFCEREDTPEAGKVLRGCIEIYFVLLSWRHDELDYCRTSPSKIDSTILPVALLTEY